MYINIFCSIYHSNWYY